MKKNLGEGKEDDIWPNEGKVEKWVLMLMFRKLCLIMIFENMEERLNEEIKLKLRKISKFNLKENWTS
jgi:hypothetical protein